MGGRFQPLIEMSLEERRQLITLPSSAVKLTPVKHLVLYRSDRVRLPRRPGFNAARSSAGLIHECERAA
jgi:hypothetical protein